MDPLLLAAALLAWLLGAAHSGLGERYILIRLFRRDLPKLFGSDRFTKRTLRFGWHITTVAWWGAAVVFLVLATGPSDTTAIRVARVLSLTFAATSLVTAAISRGRHLAWPIMAAIAALAWPW